MKLELKQMVYHEKICNGRQPMKVVGIREKEVELKGSWFGEKCTPEQPYVSWISIEGVSLIKGEEPKKSLRDILEKEIVDCVISSNGRNVAVIIMHPTTWADLIREGIYTSAGVRFGTFEMRYKDILVLRSYDIETDVFMVK